MKKLLLILLIFAIATPLISYKWVDNYFNSTGKLAEEKVIIIPKGAGVIKISQQLAKEGIIEYPKIFAQYIRFFKDDKSLKAGEYAFPAGVSPSEAYNIIKSGKVVLHKITFPEGITVYKITEILNAEDKLSGEIERYLLEGHYMPDSYHFERDETRENIISMMEEKLDTFLEKEWEKRDKNIPIKTKEDAIILASIVEKETGIPCERGLIAAVFINRLRINMRLQSDPTTIYGITHGEGKLERKLTYDDLREKTEYNTYKINGLPHAAISNPGKESIVAVLNPPETDDLYFVANGEGGHTFAKTMEEHLENVKEWRKIQKGIKLLFQQPQQPQ